MKRFKFIYDLIIPITIGAVGLFLGSWLFLQYSEPQLVYYTDGYYQNVSGLSIGELYIVNEGRAVDKNITVVIAKEIPLANLTVSYISSPFHAQIKDSRTYIIIDTLKPGEGAEVVFKIKTDDISFDVENVLSDSGNISHRDWTEPWWHLSKLQISLVTLLVTIGFGFGFCVGLWKNDIFKKAQ